MPERILRGREREQAFSDDLRFRGLGNDLLGRLWCGVHQCNGRFRLSLRILRNQSERPTISKWMRDGLTKFGLQSVVYRSPDRLGKDQDYGVLAGPTPVH
jgi:hypothetical protein